ncbi:MAG: NAD-dependent epimerase [Gammaproteobacteria bacterium]|nr:NAD-dependent epimerase [Gammaproteobacteria bacterium]
MKVIVTGAAGFIGSFTAERLAKRGDTVVGVDNLNDYYDVDLKRARLQRLGTLPGFSFEKVDIADRNAWQSTVDTHRPDRIVHLAAQAGVRHSIEHPHAYVDANITGFLNILESVRDSAVDHLVFASTSAVYGANTHMPFSTADNVDHPLSMYAATKKANELMAHAYSHLYGVPATGLRFFTVYGPWGRPDMALFVFTRKILAGEPIEVFNHGNHRRDFTYIDDIVEGIVRILDRPPRNDPAWRSDRPDPSSSAAPYRLYNIGNGEPVQLLRFIEVIETQLGRRAVKRLLPMQAGDVKDTFADVGPLAADLDYRPATPIEEGIARFIHWYRDYYGVADAPARGAP